MAGQSFSMTQLAALWVHAGGPLATAPEAVARAWAESNGVTTKTSPNPDGGTNSGLWQLDTPHGVGAGHTVAELQNPLLNAQITVRATNGGRNWGQWSDNWQSDIGAASAAVHGFSQQAAHHPGVAGGLASTILNSIMQGIGGGLGLPALGDLGAAGAAGAQAAGGVGSVLLPPQVTDFLSAAERFVHSALWIIDPTNWVRILAGVAGALLVILGIGALTRAA